MRESHRPRWFAPLFAIGLAVGGSEARGAAAATPDPSDPHFTVEVYDDFIFVYGWPATAAITVTIDDPANGIGVDFARAATGAADTGFVITLSDYDVQPGHNVQVTDGTTTLTHVVRDLAITRLDPELDLVAGTAVPGSKVNVWVGGPEPIPVPFSTVVTADSSGHWFVGFASLGYDLIHGALTCADQHDPSGGATSFTVNPTFNVQIWTDHGLIFTWGWLAGVALTLTIDDPETGPGTDFSAKAVYRREGIGFNFEPGGFKLALGQVVRLTDGVSTVEHVVRSVYVLNAHAFDDKVLGTAAPGSRLRIEAETDCGLVSQLTTADASGLWVAQLDCLDTGGGGSAWQSDQIGNNTGIAWTVPQDTDEDGLPDTWEQQFGLEANVATGDDGPDGDPNQDGTTNLEDFLAGTHPRGIAGLTRYFAEGASGGPMEFTCRLSLANPSPTATAHVLLTFLRAGASTKHHHVTVSPQSRRTVDAASVLGTAFEQFSTVVETDTAVVADRTMRWDHGEYGGHAETGVEQRATTWYFAEGATHSGFDLFYLLQNPNATSAQVKVTYLLPTPRAPITKSYVVAPTGRTTIWVDTEDPGLANADVSAIIEVTNDVPIIVERAMYLSGSRSFEAGHESAGILSPATRWFFAEGATGNFFDLFVLIANPESADAEVQATYYLPNGSTLTKPYTVAANSRSNIWVDLEEFPEGSGNRLLVDSAVAIAIESLNGVALVAERSMWWPGPTAETWAESHNTPGTTETGEAWALADGEVGGDCNTETYILVANTSPVAGQVRVTLLFEGASAPVSRTFDVLASSRFNVDVRAFFPDALDRRFGAVVESVGPSPLALVVEHAVYWDAAGPDRVVRSWAAGTDAVAARLR